MEDVVPYYAQHKIGRIITSPSKRAVESAQILGSRLGIRPQVNECLLEVNVGDLEGESERDPGLLTKFFSLIEDWLIHNRNTGFPGGESLSDVEKRLKVLESLMSSGPAIIVGHSTLFAVFLGTRGVAFKKVEELFLPCAGIASFSLSERNWRIETKVSRPNRPR